MVKNRKEVRKTGKKTGKISEKKRKLLFKCCGRWYTTLENDAKRSQ